MILRICTASRSGSKLFPGNIIDATNELGIRIPTDQASGQPIGGYFCPHNIDITNVTRSSAREAYYNTAEARTNLHLVTGQHVTKLVTGSNSTGGYGSSSVTVTGVEVSSKPKPVGSESKTNITYHSTPHRPTPLSPRSL